MTLDDLINCFAMRGERAYEEDLEAVTQSAHALQCGELAIAAGSGPALVAAAVLHDVGHILDDEARKLLFQAVDDRHEDLGAELLRPLFGAAAAEPVRLHVSAKRYLCATRPDYFGRLSSASVYTLKLQGGPMSPEEARAFEAQPYAEYAVKLRFWDEAAKVPGAQTRSFAAFRPILEQALI